MSTERQKIVDSAQKFAAKGQFDKAIAEYQRALREDPNDVRVLLKVGDLQLRLNAPPAAIETYARVGAIYEQQGFHQKAIAVYKQILQIDPSRDVLHLKLADLYVRLGLGPDAMQHLGFAAQRMAKGDQPEHLVAVYRKMLQVDANNVATRIRLAELLSRLNKIADAVKEFEQSCALLEQIDRVDDWARVAERLSFFKPDDVALARKLAAYYLEHESAPKALSKLQVAYKADARHVPTLELLAQAFRALGQLPKALPVLKEIARIHGDAGRARERHEAWRRVLELAPTDEEARAALKEQSERRPLSEIADEDEPDVEEIEAADDDSAEVMVDDEAEVVFDLKPSVPPGEEAPEASAPSLMPQAASQTTGVVRAPAAQGPAARGAGRLPLRPPSAGVQRPASPAVPTVTSQERNAAEASRLLGEAEIFLKYGLRGKVTDHLHRAMQLDGANLELQLRVRDLYLSMNDPAGIVRASLQVARLLKDSDPATALAEVHRALEIDPGDAQARALEVQLQTVLASLAGPDAFQDETMYDAAPGYGSPEAVYGQVQTFSEANEAPLDDGPRYSETPRPEIEEGLDEAEFFVTQGLYDDARDTLRQLLELYPNHPLVLDRWAELEQLAMMRGADQNAVGGDFSLGAVFDEESQALGMLEAEPDAVSLDDGFVPEHTGALSVEDCDTHYDLGIAYKEMGLHDDAIAEFKIATMSPVRQCIGETMIGLCYIEKGDAASAIEHFKRGLQAPQRTEHEELGLYFEMGAAYQAAGDYAEALYFFQKVEKRDPTFREVSAFVEALQNYAGHSTSHARIAPGIEDLDRAFDEFVKE